VVGGRYTVQTFKCILIDFPLFLYFVWVFFMSPTIPQETENKTHTRVYGWAEMGAVWAVGSGWGAWFIYR